MGHDPDGDTQAIVELTRAYGRALDRGRYEQLRDLFTADATAGLGGAGQFGIDQIIDRTSSALSVFDRCEHHLGDPRIDLVGDTATSRCSVRALHMRPAGETPAVYTVVGTYEDRLVRTDAGWRIAHRDLIVEHREGQRTSG